jgi:hypothetical protein
MDWIHLSQYKGQWHTFVKKFVVSIMLQFFK